MFAAVCSNCKTMVQYPEFADGRAIGCHNCGSLIKGKITVWELGSVDHLVSAEEVKRFRDMLKKAENNKDYSIADKEVIANELIEKHVI